MRRYLTPGEKDALVFFVAGLGFTLCMVVL